MNADYADFFLVYQRVSAFIRVPIKKPLALQGRSSKRMILFEDSCKMFWRADPSAGVRRVKMMEQFRYYPANAAQGA